MIIKTYKIKTHAKWVNFRITNYSATWKFHWGKKLKIITFAFEIKYNLNIEKREKKNPV